MLVRAHGANWLGMELAMQKVYGVPLRVAWTNAVPEGAWRRALMLVPVATRR